MKLFEFLRKPSIIIKEGGNAQVQDKEDPSIVYSAQKIDLETINRTQAAETIKEIISSLNQSFQSVYQVPIFGQELFNSNEYVSGSSKHFFNTTGISDEEFVKYKKKVGDIDIQCDVDLKPNIQEFLDNNYKKQFGPGTLLGYTSAAEQFNALFYIPNLKVTVQIDFEFGQYDKEIGHPTEWYKFSHSSEWNDITANVKGVFHKYIYRALPAAKVTAKHVATYKGAGKNRAINIEPEPTQSKDISFAVGSSQGGGASYKYTPYIDPQTGKQMDIKGVPVQQELPSAQRTYVQNLDKQFEMFFGVQPSGNDKTLQKSYLGTLELMNKYLDQNQITAAFEEFIRICFDEAAQMIDRDNPKSDAEAKFAAIDKGLEILKISNKKQLRDMAVAMAQAYEADYLDQKDFKQYFNSLPKDQQDAINVSSTGKTRKDIQYNAIRKRLKAAGQWPIGIIKEEDAKPNYSRQGIEHIYSRRPDGTPSSTEMKDLSFVQLCDEIAQLGGNLDNVPINLKVDGMGIRFAKDQSGQPLFITSSRPDPVTLNDVGSFLQFNQNLIAQGKLDPNSDIGKASIARAINYDKAAETILTSKFIKTLPPDTIVQAEMMYDSDMTPDSDGFKTFVNIPYDVKKLGKIMTLAPFMVKKYSTGERLPNEQEILKNLFSSSDSNIKILSNELSQSGINVSKIIAPVVNLPAELRATLISRKASDRAIKAEQVTPILDKARAELSKAIIDSPKLKGMEILGPYNEGIVGNMPSGRLFKVTSPLMKEKILQKQSFGDTKTRTAVVAMGSFAGHRGHEQLINIAIDRAAKEGGTPFVYVGSKVGPDDPFDVATKLETLRRLFPGVGIMSVDAQMDLQTDKATVGQFAKKVEYELMKKPPYFNHIIVSVGEDREPFAKSMVDWADKRFGGHPNLKHVKWEADISTRNKEEGGTGVSTTQMREALKTMPEEQAFQIWSKGFNVETLGPEYIKNLMNIARQNMGLSNPTQPVSQPAPVQPAGQPVTPQPQFPISEIRLFNALVRPKFLYEGGFSSIATQQTEVTPQIVRAAKSIIDNNLIPEFNNWLISKSIIDDSQQVKSGVVTGSGAHHSNDPQETIYGDIDMQIVVPDLYSGALHTTGERQYKWKKLVLDFVKETKPNYLNFEETIKSELPVVNLGNEKFIQVDFMPHTEKYSEWGKYRATAERGVTGLLNGNLFSVLGELLSLNLQHSGVQYKTPKDGGMRQKFDALKKGNYDLGEISSNVRTFILDILKDEHNKFGQGQLIVDPLLAKNPGVKTVNDLEELRIQPLVNAIKGLAKSFELNDLFGKGNLESFSDSNDFLDKFVDMYSMKAHYASTNKKFDKATTDQLRQQISRKQEKIQNGLEYVKFLFATDEPAPRFLDWMKNNKEENNLKEVNPWIAAGSAAAGALVGAIGAQQSTDPQAPTQYERNKERKKQERENRRAAHDKELDKKDDAIDQTSSQTNHVFPESKQVPISEECESIMKSLIKQILINESKYRG